ncbi:MAG: hypothetical protein GY759_02080 [Chloroflexi bacterium]|nr:hypothetical protein [Chloroflexota bacterium]
MSLSIRTDQLLQQAIAILPFSDEDLIYKGIAVGASERIWELKKARLRLQEKYGSLDGLERKIQDEGVSPDDHTLYVDLLEWRAINDELIELMRLIDAL